MSTQPLTDASPARPITLPRAGSLVWPVAALVLLAALHLSNALGRAINWDEFNHYSQIHQLLRGELTAPLQTFQARFFSWVALLRGDNIDQILAARGVMLCFVLATAGAIYALANGFASRKVALVCACAWLSAGFVLQHGTSYRPDAMAAALLMTSLALMVRTRLDFKASLLIAALAALALLVTIKSVLYAPAFAGIAWLRWQEADRTREASLRLILLGLLVPGLFGLFYAAHMALLPHASGGGAIAAGSASQMFQPLAMPYWRHMLKAAATAPFLTAALLALPVLLWRARELSAPERAALTGLALPIISLLFYVNTYAYFFVFILAPVSAACLVAFRIAIKRYTLLGVSLALAINGAGIWALEERETLAKQRQIVAAADQIFASPVAYFDFAGMVGDFPKANGFLTQWGAENYRRGGREKSMAAAMERRAVPLVIENDPVFSDTLRGNAPVPALLPTDVAVLRDSYIPFWGPYWLAGEALAAGESRLATIRVPGTYTVRDGSIALDGMLYLPGEVLQLHRGRYQIAAYSDAARLIWGERLAAPTMPAPMEPYWTQF